MYLQNGIYNARRKMAYITAAFFAAGAIAGMVYGLFFWNFYAQYGAAALIVATYMTIYFIVALPVFCYIAFWISYFVMDGLWHTAFGEGDNE